MFHAFRFLTQLTQSPDGYLHETPAGTSTPAASPDSGATPAAATSAVTPSQPATPAAPLAPATPGAPDGYVPSYRLRETREAAVREANQGFAAREAQIRAEADRYRQQVLALTGVSQPTQNPEVAAVRAQFAQLYPGLVKMEERAAQLEQLLERAGDLESQNDHYWQTYGRQTMDKLFSSFSETLGAPLTDEAKRQVHSSFVGWVQSSPELTQRYSSDPTIVNDFVKAFTSSFIDPVRRTATATVAGRAAAGAAIPRDTPAGAPRTAPAPTLGNIDERAAAAWQLYQTTAKP